MRGLKLRVGRYVCRSAGCQKRGSTAGIRCLGIVGDLQFQVVEGFALVIGGNKGIVFSFLLI